MRVLNFILLAIGLLGCASYKQNIMFKTGDNFTPEPVKQNAQQAEQNYRIQKNDILSLKVFSNNGEKIIDPNPELSQNQKATEGESATPKFLVDLNGVAKFPMLGEIKVEGLTLRQAEMILQKEYETYFKDTFVQLSFENKRVVLLGAPGGQVIPLNNENTSLAEVIALAKGINLDGKAKDIRVIRGQKVYVADFSTIEGFQKGNMIIEPGDIVYIEPVRRPLAEGIQDYRLLVTMLVSVSTFVILLTR